MRTSHNTIITGTVNSYCYAACNKYSFNCSNFTDLFYADVKTGKSAHARLLRKPMISKRGIIEFDDT